MSTLTKQTKWTTSGTTAITITQNTIGQPAESDPAYEDRDTSIKEDVSASPYGPNSSGFDTSGGPDTSAEYLDATWPPNHHVHVEKESNVRWKDTIDNFRSQLP